MPFESRIVLGQPTELRRTANVFAYGDSDDASRIVAVLAARIQELSEEGSVAAKAAALCLAPRTAWKDRLDHLASALDDTVQRHDVPVFALLDADALAFDERESFEQERASLLRRDLYRVIRDSARDGGWLLVRSARASGSALDELDLPRDLVPSDDRAPDEAVLFAAECQPLAEWLVTRQILRPRDLGEIKRTVKDPEGYLIDLTYQELPGPVQDSAKVMAALRAPQSLNGHYGRLTFSASCTEPTACEIPHTARDALIECGMIQPADRDGTWRMPRLIRGRLRELAELTLGPVLDTLHRLEAVEGMTSQASVDVAVEAHYHAVCTGDVELAKQTARFYGSELCEVARRISMEAQQAEASDRAPRFRLAAELYRHILQRFDDTDAYAWEYFGFNLALAGGDTAQVRNAYEKAFRLRPHSPLYHGRLVGYRGQLGEDIVEQAVSGIHRYAQEDPARDPVAWFAHAVLSGLRRGGQRDQIQRIIARCEPILRTLAPDLKLPR